MKTPSLTLLSVLLLCALCGVSQTQAEDKAIKLCGREFIRAIVYTCGGSRWRRLLNQQDLEGLSNGEQSSAEGQSEDLGPKLTRRELGHMLSTVCCQVGCHKSDLCRGIF